MWLLPEPMSKAKGNVLLDAESQKELCMTFVKHQAFCFEYFPFISTEIL